MEKEKGLRLAFVWDFSVTPLDVYGWGDGLSRALQLLASEYGYDIKVIPSSDIVEIYESLGAFSPEVILGWGSLDRPSFSGFGELGIPTALCFAGGATKHDSAENFDVIFVENQVYLDSFIEQGYNARRAFGANDDLFQPMKLAKKWDGVYPASFAKWKRHKLFAQALGKKGLAFGKVIQEERDDTIGYCINAGVTVLPQLTYDVVPYLIAQSHSVVITASSIGGSQRTTLEAMAMNVPPIVMSDSDKNVEYVKESGFGFIVDPDPKAIKEAVAKAKKMKPSEAGREYIMEKYSAKGYADSLHKGIQSIWKNQKK